MTGQNGAGATAIGNGARAARRGVFLIVALALPMIGAAPRAARAATAVAFPTSNTVVTTGWTNPTNAYAADSVVATAAPAQRATVNSDFGNFGFDASIPANSTINSVTMEVGWYVSTTASIATLNAQPYVSGTAQGTQLSDTAEPTTLTVESSTYTLTRAQLLNGVFAVRVAAVRGNSTTAFTADLDYVKVTVDYTPPSVTVGAGTNPTGSTITSGGVAALDAFTLTVTGGPATISSVSYALTGNTSASNVFVHSLAGCTGGTTYGTASSPGTTGTISMAGLTAANGTTTLYLCMTAGSTPGDVTGYVSTVAATGFAVSGSSSAGTTVTVSTPVTGVAISPTSAVVNTSGTQQFTATVSPSNATNPSVTWSVGGTGCGTVSASGLYTAPASAAAGCSVTVTTVDGGFQATANVTVNQPVTGVAISPTSATVNTSATQQFTSTVSPSDATNPSVTWSVVGGGSCGSVSASGLYTAPASVATGCGVQVTTVDGAKTASATITLQSAGVAVTGVAISPTGATVATGATQQFTATVSPSNATNKTIAWSIVGTGCGSVSSGGLYTAPASVATGCGVQVTTQDGGFTASAGITLTSAPVTTLADGTNPTSPSTVCAGGGAVDLDAFTLAASGAADSVTVVRVALSPSTASSLIQTIAVVSNDGATTYGFVTPTSSAPSIALTTPIPVPVGPATQYKLRIAPKAASAMPPPGSVGLVGVTGVVSGITATNAVSGSDTSSATVPIDNSSPADVAWTSITAQSSPMQVALGWSSAGTNNVLLLRQTGGPVLDTPPASGAGCPSSSAFTQSLFLGCGVSTGTTDTTALDTTNGFYYATFVQNACGNWSRGASAGPVYVSTLPFPVGDLTSTTKPALSIVNPARGAKVTGQFRVQVRVFSPSSAITGVEVDARTAGGGAFPGTGTAAPRVVAYGSSPTSGVFEARLTLAAGSYTLYARATNDNGASFTYSSPVGVVASGSVGDGNLLVRDNSNQLCSDCHALQSHGTESAGTKYGSWSTACRDCHAPHGTTNVYLVANKVTTPGVDGTPMQKQVFFSDKTKGYSAVSPGTNPGDVPAAGYANQDYTGICQACHERTSDKTGTSPLWRSGAGIDPTHGSGNVCTSCHKHSGGFKASCTGCHGTAGRTAFAAEAPPQDTCGNSTTSGGNGINRVGAHAKHLVAGTFTSNPVACSECHVDPPVRSGHPGTSCDNVDPTQRATMSFGLLATGAVDSWSGGTVTPSYDTTAQTCASTYCHGNFRNGKNASPLWTGSVTCGDCHDTPPAVSPHYAGMTSCAGCHPDGYSPTAVTGTALTKHMDGHLDAAGCNGCHGSATPRTAVAGADTTQVQSMPPVDTHGNTATTYRGVGAHASHANSATSLAVPIHCEQCHGTFPTDTTHSTASPVIMSFGALATANSTPATVDQTSTPTCTNWCHGLAAWGGSGRTPTWTTVDGSLKTCASCHAAPPPVATSHHPTNTTCTSCHDAAYSVGAATVNRTLHVNGSVDTLQPKGCGSCHGDLAQVVALTNADPLAAPGYDATAVDSHGNTATTNAGVGAHKAHLAPNVTNPLGCVECHPADATLGYPTFAYTDATHADGVPAVPFPSGSASRDRLPGDAVVASPSYVTGGGACSSVYCHGAFSGGASGAPSWTGTYTGSSMTCTSCHGDPPTAAPGGRTHPSNTACSKCHVGYADRGASPRTVNKSTHLNGVADYVTLACSTCHGDSTRTPVASATTLDALGQNLVKASPPLDSTGASGTAAVGAHLAHVNQAEATPLSSALACANCHTVPTSGLHANGTAAVTWSGIAVSGGATPNAYDSTNHGCTATYCHGNFQGGNRSPQTTISWGTGTLSQLSCTACHPNSPAYPHPYNQTCGDCHPGGYSKTGAATGTVAAATHVDGSVTKSSTNCTSCHGYLAGSPGPTYASGSYSAAAPGGTNPGASEDSVGQTAMTSGGVGAHLGHLSKTVFRQAPISCDQCHAVPTDTDPGWSHATGTGTSGARATLTWNTLATGATNSWFGATTTPQYTGSNTATLTAGVYGTTGGSCNNVYCHGQGWTRGGNASPIAWTGSFSTTLTTSSLTCTSCHADPPASPHPGNTSCQSCHGAGYSNTAVNKATHVDGLLTKTSSGCTSCHGDLGATGVTLAANTTAAAPGGTNPGTSVDTVGSTAFTVGGVGAHFGHLGKTVYRSTAIACSQCHALPPSDTDVTHASDAGSGGARAGFSWGNLASGSISSWFGSATSPSYAGSTTGTGGTTGGTCSNVYCHGQGWARGGNASTQPWTGTWSTVSTTSAMTCTSCHGTSPGVYPGYPHPPNAVCSDCHGAGYSSTAVNKATHVDGTLNKTSYDCTQCHGLLTSAAGVTYASGSYNAAAPGFASPGTSEDVSGQTAMTSGGIGAHLSHLGKTNFRSAAITCADCHAVPTDTDPGWSHATGVGQGGARASFTWGSLASGTVKNWWGGAALSPAYSGSTTGSGGATGGTCSSVYCHGWFTGGNTTAVSWTGTFSTTLTTTSLTCASCHGDPPANSAHQNMTAATNCGQCHPGYGASTITDKTKHMNGVLDGGESQGNNTCWSCHTTNATSGTNYQAMQSDTTLYHHVMEADVKLTSSVTTYPTTQVPTTSTTDQDKTCVQCHADHNVFNPALNTSSPGRGYNLRSAIGSAPPASATTITATPAAGNYTNTDFSSTSPYGICASCHSATQNKNTTAQKNVDGTTTTLVIDGAGFTAAAHNYTVAGQIASGSAPFLANCMKCHSDPPVGTTYPQYQNGTFDFVVHTNPERNLLAPLGQTPADPYEENFCYRCHSHQADALAGTKKPADGSDWYGATAGQPMSQQAEGIYTAFQRTFEHPVTLTSGIHKDTGEGSAAGDGTLSGTNRHIECADCHNPHATQVRSGAMAGSVTAYVTGTPDTLTDSAKTWTSGQLTGYTIRMVSGAQAGKSSVIYASGSTVATQIQVEFATAPVVGDKYVIIESGRRIAPGSNPTIAPALAAVGGVVPAFSAKTPPNWDDSAGCGASGTANSCEAITTAYQLPTYTATPSAAFEAQVCVKCHSSWAYGSSPPNAPSGQPTTAAGSAQTWANTVGVAMRESDLGGDLNPYNAGHHAVFARGNNQPMVSSATTTQSVLNASWPRFTSSTVSVTAGQTTVTLGSGTWPTGILPGWMIFIGSTAPAAATAGWYEVAAVNGPTTLTLDRPCAANTVSGNVVTATTCGASQPYTLTPGLGATFVPPWGPWSRLVCSDCHASFSSADPLGPHGSSQKWMLEAAATQTFVGYTSGASANPSASVVTLTPTDTNIFCLNCHRRDVYGDFNYIPTPSTQVVGAVYKFSRQSHPADYANGSSASYRTRWGITCMNCHGGARQGGIHGENYGQGGNATGGSYSGKRLLAGSSWYAVTRGSPITAGKCWTKGSTDAVDGCGHAHSGVNFQSGVTNYDYESTQTAGVK